MAVTPSNFLLRSLSSSLGPELGPSAGAEDGAGPGPAPPLALHGQQGLFADAAAPPVPSDAAEPAAVQERRRRLRPPYPAGRWQLRPAPAVSAGDGARALAAALAALSDQLLAAHRSISPATGHPALDFLLELPQGMQAIFADPRSGARVWLAAEHVRTDEVWRQLRPKTVELGVSYQRVSTGQLLVLQGILARNVAQLGIEVQLGLHDAERREVPALLAGSGLPAGDADLALVAAHGALAAMDCGDAVDFLITAFTYSTNLDAVRLPEDWDAAQQPNPHLQIFYHWNLALREWCDPDWQREWSAAQYRDRQWPDPTAPAVAARHERVVELFAPATWRLNTLIERISRPALVFRGISVRVSMRYRSGTAIPWCSFTSTTADEETAMKFAGQAGTWFGFQGYAGASIGFATPFPTEREVLFCCGTMCEVGYKFSDTLLLLLECPRDIVWMAEWNPRPLDAAAVVALRLDTLRRTRTLFSGFRQLYVEPTMLWLAVPDGMPFRQWSALERKRGKLFTVFDQWLDDPSHNTMLICGEGGRGKSSAAVALCGRLAEGTEWTPVFVGLSEVDRLGDPGSMLDHIKRTLLQCPQPEPALELLKQQRIVWFLDSFDTAECATWGDERLLPRCGLSDCPQWKFVVTSRSDYLRRQGIEHYQLAERAFWALGFVPFNEGDVEELAARVHSHALTRTARVPCKGATLRQALGAEMQRNSVLAVFPGGPAAKGDVRPGWRLAAVGGTPVHEDDVDAVLDCGRPGPVTVAFEALPVRHLQATVSSLNRAHPVLFSNAFTARMAVDVAGMDGAAEELCGAGAHPTWALYRHWTEGHVAAQRHRHAGLDAVPADRLQLRAARVAQATALLMVLTTSQTQIGDVLAVLADPPRLLRPFVERRCPSTVPAAAADGAGEHLGVLLEGVPREHLRELLGCAPLRLQDLYADGGCFSWRHRSLEEYTVAAWAADFAAGRCPVPSGALVHLAFRRLPEAQELLARQLAAEPALCEAVGRIAAAAAPPALAEGEGSGKRGAVGSPAFQFDASAAAEDRERQWETVMAPLVFEDFDTSRTGRISRTDCQRFYAAARGEGTRISDAEWTAKWLKPAGLDPGLVHTLTVDQFAAAWKKHGLHPYRGGTLRVFRSVCGTADGGLPSEASLLLTLALRRCVRPVGNADRLTPQLLAAIPRIAAAGADVAARFSGGFGVDQVPLFFFLHCVEQHPRDAAAAAAAPGGAPLEEVLGALCCADAMADEEIAFILAAAQKAAARGHGVKESPESADPPACAPVARTLARTAEMLQGAARAEYESELAAD
eukprot:TRINITY_DN16295_c1_g1_i1.p1 TRINITY_DN16295_c1_g1~~TRINITY_DN16295_c1_g1_i1.p1  ORF type:complete len:1324 (+),score=366.12 TRINITY_DN16295_c1_g1_i1:77-3973(+)